MTGRRLCHISILLCLFSLGLPAASWSMDDVDHSLFADLLKRYVKHGVVDYQGFKSEEEKLDGYLKVLKKTDTGRLSRNEQFAFYINTYNAWTIKLILGAYPGIKSIWDLGGRIIKWRSPFRKKMVRIEGKTISLDYLEHGMIRPRFKDPRVHFAVNCASKSCPPLISEPYIGSILDQQLDASTRAFLHNPQRNYLQANTLYVSKIFKWYAEDFDNDIVSFFLRFAQGELKEKLIVQKDEIEVKYLEYDWSLNGK